jgi:hypothetical protein
LWQSGQFYDGRVENLSHHAVVPNVSVVADIEVRIARLTHDEKRLFALVGRSCLAAVKPDYEYRQTTVLMDASGHAFRALGRIPRKAGKAVYGLGEPDDEDGDDGEPSRSRRRSWMAESPGWAAFASIQQAQGFEQPAGAWGRDRLRVWSAGRFRRYGPSEARRPHWLAINDAPACLLGSRSDEHLRGR